MMEGFSGSGSWMGFVPACEGNSVEVVVWPEVSLDGWAYADKCGYLMLFLNIERAFFGFFQ